MKRTVLMINIYLILTKFRDFRDIKKFAKFNTRRPKIAPKLNTRNLIPFFIFFQVWERAESSKSCNLIGSESGRYFTIFPAYPGGIVGSFIHKFVCCLWMSKTVIFKLFFLLKLALLLALAGEKWILLFRPKIWRENQASPLSLSVQQAVMFCLVHKVLCTCRTVVSLQSCSWNVQWNPALRPPRL